MMWGGLAKGKKKNSTSSLLPPKCIALPLRASIAPPCFVQSAAELLDLFPFACVWRERGRPCARALKKKEKKALTNRFGLESPLRADSLSLSRWLLTTSRRRSWRSPSFFPTLPFFFCSRLLSSPLFVFVPTPCPRSLSSSCEAWRSFPFLFFVLLLATPFFFLSLSARSPARKKKKKRTPATATRAGPLPTTPTRERSPFPTLPTSPGSSSRAR